MSKTMDTKAQGKYTAGPWKVQQPVGTWMNTVGDPYGHGQMHVADVRGWGHLTGVGACRFDEDKAIAIQEANARLIAAAPDYHTATAAILGFHDTAARAANFTRCGCEVCAVLRPIHAKAEGQPDPAKEQER